jgi:hypothetical protein
VNCGRLTVQAERLADGATYLADDGGTQSREGVAVGLRGLPEWLTA